MTACPKCSSENINVVSSKIILNNQRKRRFKCLHCLHRWNQIFDKNNLIKYSYRPNNAMTEDQVREILLRRDLSDKALAKMLKRSRSAIWKVRRGLICANLAKDISRWTNNALSCTNCLYWRGGRDCSMGQPDIKEEGIKFANDCDLYIEK